MSIADLRLGQSFVFRIKSLIHIVMCTIAKWSGALSSFLLESFDFYQSAKEI